MKGSTWVSLIGVTLSILALVPGASGREDLYASTAMLGTVLVVLSWFWRRIELRLDDVSERLSQLDERAFDDEYSHTKFRPPT